MRSCSSTLWYKLLRGLPVLTWTASTGKPRFDFVNGVTAFVYFVQEVEVRGGVLLGYSRGPRWVFLIQEVRGGYSSFKRSQMGFSSTIDPTNFPTSRAGSFEGSSRPIQPRLCSHDGVRIVYVVGGVPRHRAPSSCAHGYGLF